MDFPKITFPKATLTPTVVGLPPQNYTAGDLGNNSQTEFHGENLNNCKRYDMHDIGKSKTP